MKARKLVFLAVMVLVICGVCQGSGEVGKKAPEFTIRQWITENPPVGKGSAGKARVVEFWATWCAPCVRSIPHLIELNNKYSKKGVEFISLSQDKSAEKLRKFVKQKKINYHVAIDNGTADWYGVTGYPTVFVLNRSGDVAWKGYPWSDGFEKAIAKASGS